VTFDDLVEVQPRIQGGTWRADPQAKTWAGIAVAEVLGLDLAEPRTRKRKGIEARHIAPPLSGGAKRRSAADHWNHIRMCSSSCRAFGLM
jgi:hypothetical protein